MTNAESGDHTLVPFGKYKGQPVAALAADATYSEWLMAQPWFRERHVHLYQILMVGGRQPEDTPEHNEMQARFLDRNWALALELILSERSSGRKLVPEAPTISVEHQGWDVYLQSCADDGTPKDRYLTVCVELKPDLGDDYPAVLRQMKGYPLPDRQDVDQLMRCLVVRRAAFERVTAEQVYEFFRGEGIQVVSEARIEKVFRAGVEVMRMKALSRYYPDITL